MKKTTVLIPIYNEGNNLGIVIKTLDNICSSVNFSYEVLLVYDESTDDTLDVAKELMKKYPNIKLIYNSYDKGFGWAIKSGMESIDEGCIVVSMADLCDDPNTIPKMYKKLKEGYDVICGSRYMRGGQKLGGPPIKSFFSRLLSFITYLFTGIPTLDCTNAFKMYSKEVVDTIPIKGEKGFALSMQMVLAAYFNGFKITEVPTTWKEREEGESKFGGLKLSYSYLSIFLWAVFNSIRFQLIGYKRRKRE